MSRFINAVYNFIRPARKYIWFFVVTILFILVSIYSYNSFIKPTIAKPPSANIANADRRGMNLDIYFFHVDWCPHCIKAAPEWKKFTDKMNGTVVNGYNVFCHDIDCTDTTDPKITEMIKTYNIEGYPTVKVTFDNGKVVDFDSKISANSLATFVTTISSTT